MTFNLVDAYELSRPFVNWHRKYEGLWRFDTQKQALELYLYREPDIPREVSYKLHLQCLNGAFFDRALQVGDDTPPPTLTLEWPVVKSLLDEAPGALIDDILQAFLTTWELSPGRTPQGWTYEAMFYLRYMKGAVRAHDG